MPFQQFEKMEHNCRKRKGFCKIASGVLSLGNVGIANLAMGGAHESLSRTASLRKNQPEAGRSRLPTRIPSLKVGYRPEAAPPEAPPPVPKRVSSLYAPCPTRGAYNAGESPGGVRKIPTIKITPPELTVSDLYEVVSRQAEELKLEHIPEQCRKKE